MSTFANRYLDGVIDLLRRLQTEEMENINRAAKMLADAVENKQRIFAFGATHSSLPIQDLVYRAGGLMLINPIYAPGIESLDNYPATMTSQIEQLPGYAKIILDKTPIQSGDVLIIVSVSGRNAVPVEMAELAKQRGIKVIGVTSWEYTKSVTSRVPSGKKLYEFCDLVLDNKVEKGDAMLSDERMPQKFTPASGVTSNALLHAVVAATIEELLERGITPPVFLAGNVDGGKEYNERLLAEYKDRIFFT